MLMNAQISGRKLAAILSADVAGYSRLMRQDESATVAAHRQGREAIISAVARHGGRVVHTAGDSVLAEFASAVHAVQCAIETQKTLAAQNGVAPEAQRMHWRIGINLGDIITEGDDIHGDGVNVAARIQALAVPGGICISGLVYSQVKRAVNLPFVFTGRHKVKNIAEPVPVYRVGLEASGRPKWLSRILVPRRIALGIGVVALVSVAAVAYWQDLLPGFRQQTPMVNHTPATAQASLVVLPFANLSHDPAQDYFSDGLTNELIISLSKLPSLFVIASNSAFVYKGKPAKAQDIGKDLGVRYLVEGSVQKSDDRVRITVQLTDTQTGFPLWSDRYDRRLTDLFALQDEVTRQIITALSLTLNERERRLLASRYTHSIEAYDLFLRGRALYIQSTPQANHEARAMLQRAIKHDPGFARAHASLALTHTEDFRYGWSNDLAVSNTRALEAARRAIELDAASSQTYQVQSYVQLFAARDPSVAIRAAKRAIELDNNNADAYVTLGISQIFDGDTLAAVSAIRHGMRLNPHYPSQYATVLGMALYFSGHLDDAVAILQDAAERNPTRLASYLLLAASSARLASPDDAAWAATHVRVLDPNFKVEQIERVFPIRDTRLLDSLKRDLRTAGLP